MESKKINQLATELAPDLSDLTIIGDPTTGISKKITLSQMASLFTGTVEEYANFAAFPLVGVADTIYIAKDTNVIYRWDSTAYVVLSPNVIASLVFNDANGFDGTIALVGSVATLTITTALTSGSVPFIGASGALTQDNSNLFFDDTNNRLGIATASPTTPLDIFGSGIIGRLNATSTNNAFLGFASNGTNKWSAGNVQSDHRFRIFSEANSAELITILQTGEFGIGIANPTTKFHIDGAASALIANLDANVSVAKSVSYRSDNSARINLEVSGTESGSNAGANFFIRTFTDAGSLLATPITITRSTGIVSIPSLALADLTGTLAVVNGGTGLTTLTAGYIPFGNGTSAFGSSASLFWDNTNSRLGINQNTPLNQLHIVGIGTSIFSDGLRIERNGVPSQYSIFNYNGGSNNFLAVNTTTGEPAFYWLTSINGTSTTTRMTLNTGTYMLDVSGAGRFTAGLTATSATFSALVTSNVTTSINATFNSTNATGSVINFKRSGTNYGYLGNSAELGIGTLNALELRADNNLFLTTTSGTLSILSTGNIGINTTTPGQALEVNGNIISSISGKIGFRYSSSNATLYSYLRSASNSGVGPIILAGGFESGGGGNEAIRLCTNDGAGNERTALSINNGGSVTIAGSLSKGSGSFRIDHPLESMTETHQLVHSFVEAPQADLYYRGKIKLINGKGQANIDEVSTMTEGTFEVLCREVQCFTTNESGWDLIKGKVIGNIIYIESQNTNSKDEISWLVIGERKDKHIMFTDWTDENGKVIVEPIKPIIEEQTIKEEEIITPIEL